MVQNTAQWGIEVWKETWSEVKQRGNLKLRMEKTTRENKTLLTTQPDPEHKTPLEESQIDGSLKFMIWTTDLKPNPCPNYIYSNSCTNRLEKRKVMSISKHKNSLLQSLLNCVRYPVFKKITGQMKRHVGSLLLN